MRGVRGLGWVYRASPDRVGACVSGTNLDSVAALGERVIVTMGIPPKWYGGKVVQQSDDGRRTIAYDDGDVREVLDTELEKLLAARPTALLKRANPADEGVIANVSGLLRAEDILLHNARGRSKVIGTLLGKTEERLGNSPIYHGFLLRPLLYPPQLPTPRPRRSSGSRANNEAPTAAAGKSEQDRFGYRTFRRGDNVKWTAGKMDDVPSTATVYGVGCPEADTSESKPQDHKVLALRCQKTGVFFVGGWPSWTRVTKEPGGDPDDDEQVVTMSREESEAMVADCTSDTTYDRLTTVSLLVGASKKVPPWVALQRAKQAKKKQEDVKKKRKADAEAEEEAAEAAEVEEIEEPDETPNPAKPKPHSRRRTLQPPLPPPAPSRQPLPDKPKASPPPVQPAASRLPSKQAAPSSPPMPPPNPTPMLPHGWKSNTDGAGKIYYYNKTLNTSQYHEPLHGGALPHQPPLHFGQPQAQQPPSHGGALPPQPGQYHPVPPQQPTPAQYQVQQSPLHFGAPPQHLSHHGAPPALPQQPLHLGGAVSPLPGQYQAQQPPSHHWAQLPQPSSMQQSTQHAFWEHQKRDRVTQLRAMLPVMTESKEKLADLKGELAVLESHGYGGPL